MYTKFDHKKKNYYTIQENKENKIKHNTGIIVDYMYRFEVYFEISGIIWPEKNIKNGILIGIISSLIFF